MEILLVVLRFLHIIFGIAWVGTGVTTAWLLHPLANSIAKGDGSNIIRAWYSKSRFNIVVASGAIITTAAGLILWGMRADGMDLQGFTRTGSIVMSVGALFGLLAFGHGIGMGRMSAKFGKMIEGGNASEEELAAMEARLGRNANISAILSVIAACCMSFARYLP